MSLPSLSEARLWELLNRGEAELSPALSRLWETIRIPPVKWAQHPYGDSCGGFWTVAVFGTQVVWFNNHEDGFNISRYREFGTIDGYGCNQSSLREVLQTIINAIEHGYDLGPRCGPPQAIPR